MDCFWTSVPGCLCSSHGATKKSDEYHGGAIIVDHISSYIDIRHQVTLGTADTIRSKHAYEQDAYEVWVVIKMFRTDNGVFCSKDFIEEIFKISQQIVLSGVGAAH